MVQNRTQTPFLFFVLFVPFFVSSCFKAVVLQ